MDSLFYMFSLVNVQLGVSLPKTAKHGVVAEQIALLPHSSMVSCLILNSGYCLCNISRVLVCSHGFPPDSVVSSHLL